MMTIMQGSISLMILQASGWYCGAGWEPDGIRRGGCCQSRARTEARSHECERCTHECARHGTARVLRSQSRVSTAGNCARTDTIQILLNTAGGLTPGDQA